MALSSDLVNQFAKLTKTDKNAKTESTHYGTAVEFNNSIYVQLDGSDVYTPVDSTTNVKVGDRVMVLIKNHSATVTGNVTNPSVGKEEYIEVKTEMKDIIDEVTEVEILIAHKVSATELEAINATIENLRAKTAHFNNVEALTAEIDKLTAKFADVDHLTAKDIEAINANIESIQVKFADITDISADQLEALNAEITNLKGYTADFTYLSTDVLEAIRADIKELDVKKLSAESANLKYANVYFSNIGEAAIEKIFADSGIIRDLIVSEGKITGELVGVTIKGDLIEAGTLKADRLVVKGSDGNYYKLSTDFTAMPEVEPVEEDSIHGSTIIAESITAEKIAVDDLVAFDATIGGFNITENSLYSGVKESVDNATRGVYLDNTGQVAFGDGSNYLRYFKDQNGQYKLEISANSILLGSSNKSVEESLGDIKDDVDNINISGRNLIRQSENLQYHDYGFNTEPTYTYQIVTSTDEMTVTDGSVRYVIEPVDDNIFYQIWTYDDDLGWGFSTTQSWYENIDRRLEIVEDYNPYNTLVDVIYFYPEETTDTFVFSGITTPGVEYTFSCWCATQLAMGLSATTTSIIINDITLPVEVGNGWRNLTLTFVANGTDMTLKFEHNNPNYRIQDYGTHYRIYHPKLETGNKASDWSKAPEDFDDALTESNEHINESLEDNSEKIRVVETLIAQLEDSIEMLVTDENGASLMEQTADGGWTFSMGKTEEILRGLSEALDNMNTAFGDTSATVEILDSAVKDLGTLASYININELTDDNGTTRPVIELGTLDENGDIGEFRLLITNTDIRFTQGSSVPAYISNKALHITKAVIEEEIQLGGFVIKQRANGNLGFLWKGVTG